MSKTNEIAQIEQINKGLTSLNDTINKTADSYLKLVKTIDDNSKATRISSQTMEDLDKAKKKTIDTNKQIDALNNQLTASSQKLQHFDAAIYEQIQRNNRALADNKKAINDKIKASEAEEGSLVRMKIKLKELEAEYGRVGNRTEEAKKEIKLLSQEIGKAEEETNRFSRGVGGYRNQLGDLSRGLANGTTSVGEFKAGIISMGKAALAWLATPVGMVVAAIGSLVIAGKALVNNAKDFERAGSSLSAITGAVGKDLEFMKDKAREFAKESESSATEILVAFEKVGSKLPELLKNGPLLAEVSRNAIILSESTQGKLSVEDAAVAAAAALNAFGIPLNDSMRAINTLAAASLAGGAEVMDLVDSFKNLAPVAVSANMSLEQSAAALEVLEKFQLKAEKGGQQLKGSLLQLQSAGLGFASGQFNINDALIEAEKLLNNIQDPIKRAAEQEKIFGRENMTAGLIMMNNRQQFIDLTATIEDQVKKGTIAQDMAKTANDNLQGSYNKLGNAWKGLLLQLEDGGGLIMSIWRGIVDITAWVLNDMQITFEKVGKFFDMFRSKEALKAKEDRKIANDKAAADKAAADKAIKLAEGQAALAETARKKKEETDKKDAADKEKRDKKAAKDAKIAADKKIYEDTRATYVILDNAKMVGKETKVTEEDGLKSNKSFLDKKLKQAEEEAEKEKELAEAKKQLAIDLAIEAGNAIFEFRNMGFQKELNDLEKKKELELSNKNLTEAQKAKIEAEYTKKSNEIKRKQAVNDKLQALFNIAIGTAQGIVAALKTPALIPFIAAIGAVQAALVAAQPIPKFARGTLNAPDRGIFGEAGRELMVLPSGDFAMADKATYFDGMKFKGSKIYSNPETEKMIRSLDHHSVGGRGMTDERILVGLTNLNAATNRVEKAILSKPVSIVDSEYRQIGLGTSQHQTIYLNRLINRN